jgi:hypothetical protein
VVELPEALRPWSWQLSALTREVALGFGPWLARLEALLGPIKAARRAPNGPPYGYDGISRRGPYDRLLLSEWALAEELPEEFVRRAAMGEHSFLALAREEDASGRRCVALFDLSPWQLGAPRLAHAALLAALDRRAAAAGVAMAWGIIQDPACALHEGGPEALHRLLRARALCGDTQAGLARWREAPGAPDPGDELWWIGGAALQEASAPPNLRARLVVEEADAGLEIALHAAQAPRRLRLALPPAAVCAQFLRAERPAPPPAPLERAWRLSPRSPLLFSVDGRRLLGQGTQGEVVSMHLPNSSRQPAGRVRVLWPAPGERILAASAVQKRVMSLVAHQGRLWLDGFIVGREGARHRLDASALLDVGFAAPLAEEAALAPCLRGLPRGNDWSVAVIDAQERLFELVVRRGGGAVVSAAQVSGPVLAWGPIGTGHGQYGFAQVVPQTSPPQVQVFVGGKAQPVYQEEGAYAACFGVWTAHSDDCPSLVALRLGALDWRLLRAGLPPQELRVGAGSVVGASTPEHARGEPALVVLDEDRRGLRLCYAAREERLWEAPQPIARAVVCATRPVVAALLEDGALEVRGLSPGQDALLRLSHEGGE